MRKNNGTALIHKSAKRKNSKRILKDWNVPKRHTLFIPENLDIDKILSENPPDFGFAWHRDCFVYLLHLINDIPSRSKEFDSEFTQFYSPLVERRVYKYKKYLIYLLENDILKTDNHYIKGTGSKSKGYAFHPKYETIIKPIEITKYTLIKSILKYIDLENRNLEFDNNLNPLFNRDIPYLTKWLNKNLTIDFEAAKTYLMNEYQNDIKRKVKQGKANRKLCSRMMVIHKLNKGDFQFTIDNNAGRLYSVLTQIKKELRQFIRYNGEKLVAIDIKNSQPYLSSVLFSESHFNLNNCEKSIKHYNPLFKIDNNYKSLMGKLSEFRDRKDTQEYLSLISNGTIYEHFGKALQENNILDKNLDPMSLRSKAKKNLLNLLFAENNYKYFLASENVLKKTFPSIYETYYILKYNKHNTLACFLQNLEANLVLDIACKIISIERPELPIFTIHDSIITTEGNQEYVKGVLHNVLYEHIGLPPKLQIEKWEN